MAGRALALPIMPPERDVAACDTIEVFAEYSLAHVIYVCAQPIIFSLLRPCSTIQAFILCDNEINIVLFHLLQRKLCRTTGDNVGTQ